MIKARFYEGEKSTIADGCTQWDYGQCLCVDGITQADLNEIHFSCEGQAMAIIQPAQNTGQTIMAKIPDRLLEDGRNIRAYLYLADENSGRTVYTVSIPVKMRPKPDDYDTPAGENMLRKLIKEVGQKADNINLTDGVLQLYSGGNPIGTKVRLPTGGGREIELKNNGTALQWRYTDSNEWKDLIKIDEIKGQDGKTPEFEIRDGHLWAIY